MSLFDPTPRELAEREAALKREILGGGAYNEPAPNPEHTRQFHASEFAQPVDDTQIYSVDFANGAIETSIGAFKLNEMEVQVLATACVFALKRSFEDTLLRFAKANGVPDEVIFPAETVPAAQVQTQANAEANAALADVQKNLQPAQDFVPIEEYEVDPPHPEPKPTRVGRPRKVRT